MNFNLIKVIVDGILGVGKWLNKSFDKSFSIKFTHIYFDKERDRLRFFSKVKNFSSQDRRNCKVMHLIYSCSKKDAIEWGEMEHSLPNKYFTIEPDGEIEVSFDLPLSPIAINNDVKNGFLFPFEWDKGDYYIAAIVYIGKKKCLDTRKISINNYLTKNDSPKRVYEKLNIQQINIFTEDLFCFIGFYFNLLVSDYSSDFGYNYSKFTRKI